MMFLFKSGCIQKKKKNDREIVGKPIIMDKKWLFF